MEDPILASGAHLSRRGTLDQYCGVHQAIKQGSPPYLGYVSVLIERVRELQSLSDLQPSELKSLQWITTFRGLQIRSYSYRRTGHFEMGQSRWGRVGKFQSGRPWVRPCKRKPMKKLLTYRRVKGMTREWRPRSPTNFYVP